MKSIHSRAHRGRATILLATVSVLAVLTGGNNARAGGMTITTPQPDGITTVLGQTYLAVTGATAIVTGNVTNPQGVILGPGGPVAMPRGPILLYVDALSLQQATLIGAVINAGTITGVNQYVHNPQLSSDVAEGVHIEGGAVTRGVTNTGVITGATGTPPQGGVGTYLASGIKIQSVNFAGGITNSGTIGATIAATHLLAGHGFALDEPVGLSVQITGTPQSAYGVVFAAGGSFSGGIVNSGLITASITQTAILGDSRASSASASGVFVSVYATTMSGGLTNTGTIMARAVATLSITGVASGATSASGMTLVASNNNYGGNNAGIFMGNITNAGMIIASSIVSANGAGTNTGTEVAQGVSIVALGGSGRLAAAGEAGAGGTLIGGILNSGTIAATVTVSGPAQLAKAIGLTVSAGGGLGFALPALVNAGITNTGLVTATAHSTSPNSTYSASVQILAKAGDIQGTSQITAAGGIIKGGIVNRGTIAASAISGGSASAYGVRVALDNGAHGVVVRNSKATSTGGTFNGNIVNTGLITATASGSANLAVGIDVAALNSSRGEVASLATFTGGITNSGTIVALGGNGAGIALKIGTALPGGITNTGTLLGSTTAIDLGTEIGGTTVIHQQAGLIAGSILGSGAGDSLLQSGGTLLLSPT
ncbi:MAG TPA: hypothetical protein VKT70_05955, partial [Stellaceae bacterium]|nr:hypothetical protein [Stellaceae bacterium]